MAFTEAEATGRSADEEMNGTVELVTSQAPATKVSKNAEKQTKRDWCRAKQHQVCRREETGREWQQKIFATQQEGAIDGI